MTLNFPIAHWQTPLPSVQSTATSIAAIVIAMAATCGFAANWHPQPAACHDVTLEAEGDAWKVETNGDDPYLVGELTELRRGDQVFEFEYLSQSGIGKLELFLGPPMNQDRRMSTAALPGNKTWQSFAVTLSGGTFEALKSNPSRLRIDFTDSDTFDLMIRKVRLRPPTAADRIREKQRQEAQREKLAASIRFGTYLKRAFPMRIETVAVNDSMVAIMGPMPPQTLSLDDISLVECPIWKRVNDLTASEPVETNFQTMGERWRVVLPRQFEGRDRLHSGWRLADRRGYVSARRYATRIVPTQPNDAATFPIPENQKGMGGVATKGTLDELIELGVTAITVNIPITGFLTTKPVAGSVEIPLPQSEPSDSGVSKSGTTNSSSRDSPVHFNSRLFSKFDPVMKWAKENQVVVSAILLVSIPRSDSSAPNQSPPPGSMLVHPENEGGNYSMPDLTNARSTAAYAYILKRLARRYGDPRKPTGSVANWIAHNEVDFHQQWTNMGDQMPAVVTETYYRSMRMIHNTACEVHPNARVFASLTHHWTIEKNNQLDRMAPREFLSDLQQYSVVEGDFSWGVAYHPYPSSLFAATAWNDPTSKVDTSFNTSQITIQNIEVLTRFLDQPAMKNSRRQVRPILLSEQGFHTADDSDDAQRKQAGSLAYAMRKIRDLPSIESFHYHRWIDHPKEGGLLMGLRTLPTDKERFGKKKLSWSVYQAIGTDREESVTKDLPGFAEK